MKAGATFEIVVAGGDVLFIHDDDLAQEFAALGPMTTRRASHVEPTADGGWSADMEPVSHGTILGPYRTRREALEAEIEWLVEHAVPFPTLAMDRRL